MNYTKHIVLLTPGFAENEADTACTPYLQDYFQALQKAHPDWRLSIVAIQYPYKPGGYTWKGIEVQTIGGKNRRWNRFATWRKTKRIVQVLNRLQKIDVIHSFWLREAALIGNSLSQKLGIRHVATAMGQDIHPENKYLKRLNAPQTTFACLTESAATTLSKHFPKDQIQLFHWGLAQADFPARLSKNRDIDILAVGSLISLKRHDRLLRAVRALKDRFPNLRVVLVGEGEFRPKIEQHLSELGLEAQLELKGQLPREDVLNLMRRAKVFFHSSEFEGMGYVYAEALACGAHVVSTPAGAIRPFDKWVVAAHTYGLAAATAHFLENPIDDLPRFPFVVAATVEAFSKMYFLE